MQIYGYCRISTPQQNIERQVRNILAMYPTAHIIREVYTGTTYQGRRELDKLLHTVQAGDTIVFDGVSRMSRNADEGCQLYEDLYAQNVTLCFLKEPHINTETYRQTIQRQINTQLETGNAATDSFVSSVIAALNQYTVDLAKEQIRLAFAQAQKEVDDLHQRTREGMLTAKLNGKQIGQERGRKLVVKKAAACKDAIKKYSKDFDGALCDADCIKLIGIARNTYYKYKRELRETTLGSYMICREEQEDTLKSLRLIPVDEVKLTLAKMILAFVFSVLIYLLLFAITFLVEAVLHLEALSVGLVLENLKIYFLDGVGVFFAISPIIALVARMKKGYWLALVFAEIYSFAGLFASMSQQLKTVYPMTAVFNISGYYNANMFQVLIGVVILMVCVILSLLILKGLNRKTK